MNILLKRWSLAAILLLVPAVHAQTATQDANIFAANRMAVIHVVMSTGDNSPPSEGTGFLISGDGFVLTAKHIIAAYKNETDTPIKVRIGSLDGVEVTAEPMLFDIGIDVAIMKLRDPIGVGLTAYRSVRRGDSSKERAALHLEAIGFNLSGNIAPAPGSLFSREGGGIGGNLLWSMDGNAILFGMSGAPIFNDQGEVIGIVKGGQPGTGIVQFYPENLLDAYAKIANWQRAQSPSPEAQSAPPARTGNAIIMDGNVNYDRSGFNFAKDSVVPWNSPDGDILVATTGARPGSSDMSALFVMPYDVPPYSSPQDAGARSGILAVNAPDLASVTSCPTEGYTFHWFTPKLGEVYCVRMRSGSTFAKIRVVGIYKDRIAFDWATLSPNP